MAGKYRKIIRGGAKPAKPVNLAPLKKDLKAQAERLDAIESALPSFVPAELEVMGRPEDSELWFVTRAELREAVESGEVPVAWTVPAGDAAAAAQPAGDDTAPDTDGGTLQIDGVPVEDEPK